MEKMASKNRKSAPSIKDILLKEPYRFEFHQAIKLLEQLHPKAVPFGETVTPSEEVVEVKSRIYFESLSSDIYSLENAKLISPTHSQPVLHVNFMGIAGIQGPLPYPYTEMIIQRMRNGDHSLKDFLDIFNHRLMSILHRIRKQYVISLNSQGSEKTAIGHGLKAFLGLGLRPLQDRLHTPDQSLLNYASFYWTHPRSALGLVQILKNYFDIPVSLQKCVGRWRYLAKDQTTHLGLQGSWQKLGEGAALGTRAWDQATHFSLHLGPLTVDQLDTFLPFGKGFDRLKDIVNLYISPNIDFNVRYHVQNPPPTYLSQKSYLGWRCWLGQSLLSGDDVRIS